MFSDRCEAGTVIQVRTPDGREYLHLIGSINQLGGLGPHTTFHPATVVVAVGRIPLPDIEEAPANKPWWPKEL